MHSNDTSLGGPERAFPETALGLPGDFGDPRSKEAFGRRYWKPVYTYVRIAWAKSNDDAKDLTQDFFVWLFEGEALRRYEPARGGFRAFLKVLLRRFVGHEERDRNRLKRGGGAAALSIEGETPVLPELEADPASADPEKAFERVWLEELVGQSLARVRERWDRDGRGARFRAYSEFALVSESERPSYAELAARLGLTLGEVEKALYQAREEIREEMRSALAQGAAGDRELEDEWNRLLGA